MSDTSKTDAEDQAQAHAKEIKDIDATQGGARGNVMSEPDHPVDQEAPPPLPG